MLLAVCLSFCLQATGPAPRRWQQTTRGQGRVMHVCAHQGEEREGHVVLGAVPVFSLWPGCPVSCPGAEPGGDRMRHLCPRSEPVPGHGPVISVRTLLVWDPWCPLWNWPQASWSLCRDRPLSCLAGRARCPEEEFKVVQRDRPSQGPAWMAVPLPVG